MYAYHAVDEVQKNNANYHVASHFPARRFKTCPIRKKTLNRK